MKKYILTLFTIVALLVSLTGCGGSGSGSSVTGSENGGMTTVRVSLSQDGNAVNDAASVALYTSAAALREGVQQNENISLGARASVSSSDTDGVYRPTNVDSDGYEFNVPAGDYTFIAADGSNRAVLTGIRADATGAVASATLTPTGSIKGKVVDASGNAVAGAMVYLVDTSCVAFSGTDGSFVMTGVPTNTAFKISAIYSSDSKQMVSDETAVTVDSTLVATLQNNIVVKEKTVQTMHINGSIVDSQGNAVAGKVIMAVNGNIMAVALSDSTGKYSIPVTVSGTYKVAALNGATPTSQTVTVASSDVAAAARFVLTGGKLSSISGVIKYSSTRTNVSPKDPITDSYLVRLVGSDTYYCTTTKVAMDTNYDTLLPYDVSFNFVGIPAGTYGILVDPSGNGFYGSVGNITVGEGQSLDITNTNPIEVKIIKPSFEAYWRDLDNLTVTETSPWIEIAKKESYFDNSNASLRYCSKGSNETITLPAPTVTVNSGVVVAEYKFTSDIASQTFDCIYSMHTTWSDENTGLSGTLITESEKLSHGDYFCDDVSFIKINTEGETVLNSDGTFSSITDNADKAYCYTVSEAIAGDSPARYYEKSSTMDNLLSVSNQLALFDTYGGDDGVKVSIADFSDDLTTKNIDLSCSKVFAGHIIAGKYATVIYLDDSRNGFLGIFKLNNDNTASKTLAINGIANGGFVEMGQIVVDNNGNAYTIYIDIDDTGNYKYYIYKLGDTDVELWSSGSVGAFTSFPSITCFNCLNDGNFYFEVSSVSMDMTVNLESSFIVGNSGIVESSCNTARRCCLTDKYGYMYRLQKEFNSGAEVWRLIRTTSLDGKALSKKSLTEFTDLVGIANDSNGNPVCYYKSNN